MGLWWLSPSYDLLSCFHFWIWMGTYIVLFRIISFREPSEKTKIMQTDSSFTYGRMGGRQSDVHSTMRYGAMESSLFCIYIHIVYILFLITILWRIIKTKASVFKFNINGKSIQPTLMGHYPQFLCRAYPHPFRSASERPFNRLYVHRQTWRISEFRSEKGIRYNLTIFQHNLCT